MPSTQLVYWLFVGSVYNTELRNVSEGNYLRVTNMNDENYQWKFMFMKSGILSSKLAKQQLLMCTCLN